MGQQNIWRLASGAAAAWSILEGCCLFHAWEAMVVIWTMIDDMRSWFGRAEFDPLWVLRRFWFVEEEDRLRLSQMKCYSGSVCSCKVYGSCREIYGRPPRNSWELGFRSRSITACIVVLWNIDQKGLWRARARRPDVWAKMSPFVSGVYTMLILWSFRNQFYWMFCVWSSSILDKAQMGVWNIGKLGTRTSSTLREWVMYPPLVG